MRNKLTSFANGPLHSFLKTWLIPVAVFGTLITACNNINKGASDTSAPTDTTIATFDTTFKVEAESFADLQVLRYQVPGFNQLSLQQKQLAYYLAEAALCGRDIIYDQRSKYGLTLRKTLETVYGTYTGDKSSEDWKKLEEYCGRFWFSNGNHHHYGNEKFIPACSYEFFAQAVKASDTTQLPKEPTESVDAFLTRIKPLIFDPKVEPKMVDLRPNIDNVVNSSVNFL